MSKKYWKGLDELQQTPAFIESRDREFPQSITVDEFLGDEKLAETSNCERNAFPEAFRIVATDQYRK